MLPINRIRQAQQEKDNNDAENNKEQIVEERTDNTTSSITPPTPLRARRRQTENASTNNEQTNRNTSNRQQNTNTFKIIRRAGYFYISKDETLNIIKTVQELYSDVEMYQIVFPTLFMFETTNQVLLSLDIISTVKTVFSPEQLTENRLEQIYKLVNDNYFQYTPILNLSLLNLTRRNPKTLLQNGLLPISVAIFSEFKEPIIDILDNYINDKLSNFNLPDYISIPALVFGDNNDIFNIERSLNKNLCNYHNMYLTYQNNLLYIVLTQINPDCKGIPDIINGYTLLIPITKFTAQIMMSTLKF